MYRHPAIYVSRQKNYIEVQPEAKLASAEPVPTSVVVMRAAGEAFQYILVESAAVPKTFDPLTCLVAIAYEVTL